MERAGIYARVSDIANDRSPEQQEREARASASGQWDVTGVWADKLSASRYARSGRTEWPEFVKRVRSGSMDVAILWESARGSRELEDWAGFLNDCRDTGTRIYIVARDRLYDLSHSEDYRTLALDGVDSVYESEKTSARSRRGVADAVARGEPYGRIPYGYQRTYTREAGRPKPVAHQETHPEEAPIVREVIERIARNEAVGAILRDFRERGIKTRSGGDWSRSSVTRLVLEGVVYIGKRRHNGSPLTDGNWPAIVDDETYWRAVAVLSDPKRKPRGGGIRPGRARWLLSYIAKCSVCDGPISMRHLPRAAGQVAYYRCIRKGCVSAPVAWLDEMATVAVVGFFSLSPFYEVLTRAGSQEAQAAKDEAEAERTRLRDFEEQAISGQIGAESFARIASGIGARITLLDERARELATPPALRELVDGVSGASREERWDEIHARWTGMPLTARRAVISAFFAPVLHPANGNPAGRSRFKMPINPDIAPGMRGPEAFRELHV